MVLSGLEISQRNIIHPWNARTEIVRDGRRFTYGCGPAGYDIRVEFDAQAQRLNMLLAPGEFALASSIEHFTMPNDILGEVKDKSSWARRGLAVQNTVIEPGWKGYLTLELTNHSREILSLEVGTPIAQVIFHRVYGDTQPYEGKYQDQARGPQHAK